MRHLISPRDEVIIAGLGVALFFIAANTQTGWLYAVVSILAALLGLGFLAPRLTLRGLQATRSVVESAVEGDVVTVRLRVRNPGRLPRFLVIVEDLPVAAAEGDERKPRRFLIGRIDARAGVTVGYSMRCARRGVWVLGGLTLETAAPLGLFPRRRKMEARNEVVVHPRAESGLDLDAAAPAALSSVQQQPYRRAGSSHDFLGIREYHPGDDTRFLHWPSSARLGRLMVREFQDTGARQIAILVDNGGASAAAGDDGSRLDGAARLAAGLLRQAREEAAGVTLVAGSPGGAEVLHARDLPSGLDWLARLKSEPSLDGWGSIATQALQELPPRCQLYVLAAGAEGPPEALAALRERRITVTVAAPRAEAGRS